jgi:hypothetical protein
MVNMSVSIWFRELPQTLWKAYKIRCILYICVRYDTLEKAYTAA